jgi:hypothetical protein
MTRAPLAFALCLPLLCVTGSAEATSLKATLTTWRGAVTAYLADRRERRTHSADATTDADAHRNALCKAAVASGDATRIFVFC